MHAELALLRAQLKQAQEGATEEASRAGKALQAAQAGTEAAAASGQLLSSSCSAYYTVLASVPVQVHLPANKG